MNAVVKPEIFISWIPIGKINITPELYISWIPAGKIGLRPLIFASYIPSPEKVIAETERIVSRKEKIAADLFRQVAQNENPSAALLRTVSDFEKLSSDTKRKIFLPEKIFGDNFRRVVQYDKAHSDTFRLVKDKQKIVADTSRRIGIVTIRSDLQRKVIVAEKNSFDTCLKNGKVEKVSADLYLKKARTEIVKSESNRIIFVANKTVSKTLRNVGITEKIFSDTSRIIGAATITNADTFLITTVAEKKIGDLHRALREKVTADTCREISRIEKVRASTLIRVPHIFNYFAQRETKPQAAKKKQGVKILAADNAPQIINTFEGYGVTAVNINLGERTLSDDFQFDIVRPVQINDAVQGFLLDYPFNFLVEETTQTDMVQNVKGMYSIDDLLYTWFRLETKVIELPDGTTMEVPSGQIEKSRDSANDITYVSVYPKASEIISKVANYLGLIADIKIDDFSPSNLDGDDVITYADLLNSVFSWTSSLPQRQINIFIRGNVLHCIQRGKEDSVFDISELPHSRPIINKKFNRVLCYNPNKSNDYNDNDNDNDIAEPFSGTISTSSPYFSAYYRYSNGFLITEQSSTKTDNITSTSKTNYEYTSINNLGGSYSGTSIGLNNSHYNVYLKSKKSNTTTIEREGSSENITETESETLYYYKNTGSGSNSDVYLLAEYETTKTTEGSKNYNETETETEIRQTFHAPAGNGWYVQTVYVNGVPQGANLSQGKPGNSVSPYTIDRFQNSFTHTAVELEEEDLQDQEKDELSFIVDDSFPVRESELLDELNEALRWLHRKIVETVSLDLISPVTKSVPAINHIVDFTERVRLDGAEYFLVSNNISFTPRKMIQKLQLIRWYEL